MTRTRLVALVTAAGLAVPGIAAAAAWSVGVGANSQGVAAASALSTPVVGTATNLTTSSGQVNWTAPGGFENVATYTATASASGHNGGTCSAAASAGHCTISGLDASTPYSVSVAGKLSNWNSPPGSGSLTTATPSDTTPPTITSSCPTASTNYDLGNSGAGSWGTLCGTTARVNATDSSGVASVKIKIQSGTSCWSPTATTWSTANCTAGDGAGYFAATHGSGNAWSIALTQANLTVNDPNKAGTKSYTLSALATDSASPANSTASGTPFTVTFQTNN